MGSSELSLLGFEDMDEFRSYHDDVADLFINRSGYVFKFHNFSWIEYVLHSGTPTKQVLLKAKSGKIIEASLNINEIFLSEETLGSKHCFAIELIKTSPTLEAQKKEDEASEPIPIMAFQPSSPMEEMLDGDHKKGLLNRSSSETVQEPAKSPSPFEKEEPLVSTLLEEKTSVLLDDLPLLETFDTPKEGLFFEPDNLLESSPEPFNLIEGAERLGLDLASFAELIDEYLANLEARMQELTQAVTQGNSVIALEILSPLQDDTYHLQIPELMKQFKYLEKTLQQSYNKEEQLNALLLSKNAISDFKGSLQ